MKWICDCGCEIEFPTPEVVKGFIVSTTVCPNCGLVWKARIVKSKRIKLKEKTI